MAQIRVVMVEGARSSQILHMFKGQTDGILRIMDGMWDVIGREEQRRIPRFLT